MADPLLDRLAEFVGYETPSGAAAELGALRDVLVQLLRSTGADVSVRTGTDGDHIVATVAGPDGRAPVLVLGHYDTVWPVGRLAEAPFDVRDGWASGPGAFDMKAGLVALLWALENLPDGPAHPLRIVLTADEEVGSPSGGPFVEQACDGVAACFALEPPLAEGRLKVGRRGVARARLAVTGRAAHAGLDAASGVSATDELVDQLTAVRAALPDTPDRAVNVGRIAGGSRANVVAGAAEAELGLRYRTAADEEAMTEALRALRAVRDGAGVELDWLSHRPAWEPANSLALAAHVQAVAAEVGEHIEHGVSGGGGDANITGARGVPTVDGLGPRGRGAHAPDEAVEVASIPVRARLLRELLSRPLPS